ncbi:hypothetical protein UlMin_005519 [Ulmus minor]
MASSASTILLAILGLSLLAVATSSASLQDNEPTFYYSGNKGPQKWGTLAPMYSACASGKKQSPVNINRGNCTKGKQFEPLNKDYSPSNATLVNNGINVGIHFEKNNNLLTIDGNKYFLKQMHWHTPSEHRIDGLQFAAELHLVHIAEDGNASVVSFLYHIGDRPDPLITKIMPQLEELAKDNCTAHEQSQVPLGTLNMKVVKKKTRKYYRYFGSLTTPPCTEQVIWNVVGKVRSITQEQVNAIKAPLSENYKNNSRPCQPLDGRHILLNDEFGPK